MKIQPMVVSISAAYHYRYSIQIKNNTMCTYKNFPIVRPSEDDIADLIQEHDLLNSRANEQLRLGQHEEASKLFTHALKLELKYNCYEANRLQENGHYDQAMKHYGEISDILTFLKEEIIDDSIILAEETHNNLDNF